MGINFMNRTDTDSRTGGYYISPHCPSARTGQKRTGGQSVRFLENNGNYNVKLVMSRGLTANESSGLIVL